jgi:excisionase family DNA binding protein
MTSKREPPATLTIDEAAQQLGISRNTAYECAKTGQLPVIRLGKRLLVPRTALQRMLAGEGRAPSTTKAV